MANGKNAQTTIPRVAGPAVARPSTNPFNIFRVDESAQYLKMFVYGASGVGKTHLAATAQDCPELRDVLYVDAEAGGQTLRTMAKGNLDIVSIQNWNQLVRVYEFLQQYCKLKESQVSEAQLRALFAKVGIGDRPTLPDYKTVVIDTIDEVQDYCMKHIQGIDPQNTKLDMPYAKPGWEEYGEILDRMRSTVRNFRNLPMHVVVTCHREIKQDESQRMIIVPSLVGKFGIAVQAYFDFVGYYVAKSQPTETGRAMKRRLFIEPGANFDAKNRCSPEQGWVDEPTMEKMLDLLKGSF